MNAKMETTKEPSFEEMDRVNGGTGFDAQLFMKHLSKKYGVRTIREIKQHWTQEEHDYFNRAYERKVGDEPLGPYPD